MAEPIFDIFRGAPGGSALWLEAVSGLESARSRFEQISTQTPGKYFLFCMLSHTVIERVDTGGRKLPRAAHRKKARVA
jgi:hypothetical protein